MVALNRSFKSQIAARYTAFWHAVSQIALASSFSAAKSQRFKSQRLQDANATNRKLERFVKLPSFRHFQDRFLTTSGTEKVPQRTFATKISPNFRVNLLVRFASTPLFYWEVPSNCSENSLVLFVQFFGFGVLCPPLTTNSEKWEKRTGLLSQGFVFLTFRGAFALHDSNPYPNRSRISRYLERPCASQEGVSMLLRREGGFLRRGGGFFRRGGGFLRRFA